MRKHVALTPKPSVMRIPGIATVAGYDGAWLGQGYRQDIYERVKLPISILTLADLAR